MARKLTRDDAAKAIVGVFSDHGLAISVAEAERVIDLFTAFQSRYRVEMQESFQRTGCTAQALTGTGGAFTTAVFQGQSVPEGTELYVKRKEGT